MMLAVAVFGVSCNRYLDIQPQDKFLDQQVFDNETSVRNALNGIYLKLADDQLYGGALSCTVLDVMAQYYNCGTRSHDMYSVMNYEYDEASVQDYASDIWEGAYAVVLNLNVFIDRLEQPDVNVVSTEERQLLLGEAYGLRAYVLFDMLRLFGPVYRTDSLATSIPYPEVPSSVTSPLLPANEVIANVLRDAQKATSLLEHDPVRSAGVVQVNTDLNSFFMARNRRMNFFVVKGLEARVQLYAGNKTAALQCAKAVLEEGEKWFPWVDPTRFTQAPDRIFSAEVMFAVENIQLYNNIYDNWFASTNSLVGRLLVPFYDANSNTNRLLEVYEGQENDYRYKYCWEVNRSSTFTFPTYFKFNPTDVTDSTQYLQPLMRISEMYLIAAECVTSRDEATAYLNTLRFNRGVNDLVAGYDLSQEITRTYQKEFWGEGQLFFYYKRINAPSLKKGSANQSVSMNKAKYVVPLPLSETQFR